MGLADAIGDVFDSVKDGTGESLGMIVDAAKAYGSMSLDSGPLASRGADQDFVEKSKQRIARFNVEHPRTAAASAKLGWAASTPYTFGIARPLSTVEQVTGASPVAALPSVLASGRLKEMFDSDSWRTAWENSATVSPGQVAVANSAQAVTRLTGNKAVEKFYGINGMTYSEIAAAGDEHSENFSMRFSLASGAVDAALSWYADPFVVAGKAGRAATNRTTQLRANDADRAAMGLGPTDDLNRRGTRIRSGLSRFYHETDGYTSSELAQMDSFRKAPNGAVLASLFAKFDGDHEMKDIVWKTAAGNQEAGAALASRRRDIAIKIDRATEDLEDMRFALENVSESSRVASLNDPATIKTFQDELEADEHLLDMYNRALETQSSVSHIPRVTGADKARAYDMGHYTLRSGVLGVPIRITRSPVDRLPTGLIQYHNSEDSFTKLRDMTKRIRNLDPAVREKWLNQWVDAPDDGSRQLAYHAMRDQAIAHMGRDLGYTDDELEAVVRANAEASGSAMGVLKSRAYAAAEEGGQRVDLIRLPDETLAPRPLDTVQLANTEPVLPVDELYRALKRAQPRVSALRHAGATTQEIADSFFDTINDVWRFAVLARLGYGIRNVTDSQIRMSSRLGGLSFASMHMESAGGWISNKRAGLPAGLIRQKTKDDLARIDSEIKARRAAGDHDEAIEDLLDQKEQLANSLEALPTVPMTGQGVDEFGPYQTERAFGVDDADAEINKKLSSSDGVLFDLALSEEHRLKQHLRGMGEWDTTDGVMRDGSPNPHWTQSYLRVVNNHFRQGAIRTRLLAGESEAEVARWLRSAEGREVRRRLVHRGDSAEQIVHANAVEMNHVLPGPLRELAAQRQLTEDDVFRAFPDPKRRPPVNAEAIKYAAGEGAFARAYGRSRDKWFEWMNTFPEDVWARHPFYRKLYTGRRNQMIAQSDPRLEGVLTDDQLRVLENNARTWARREMKRVVFDVSSKSTLGNFSRFISPFYSAWEDTLVKYGRLAINNPGLIRHAQMVWTAPNKASFMDVVDEDGNPVSARDSQFPNDDEYLRVNLPGFMENVFSVGEARIPKSSANIVLQGEPWWLPGFGPMAQIPINEVAKRKPDIAESLKVILPFGPAPNSFQFLLPTAAKNAVVAQGNDARYGRSMTMIALTEMQRIAEGKREKPKSFAAFAQEIEDRTQRFWMLRTATALIAPVSVQYQSPYQLYIDEYHRMLEEDPLTADEKFWREHGDDLYRFSTSLSQDNTGVRPTLPAHRESRKLKDLIAEEPSLGWLVVGPANTGEFSRAVYVNQQLTPTKPGSDDMYRGSYDPWDAIERNQAELGWIKYTAMMDKLDVILKQRGLDSYALKDAEDLAEIRAGFTADLRKENPDWADDFDNRDGSRLRHSLQMMQRLTQDDRTKGRVDVRAMSEYLAFRKQIQKILVAREKEGGDKTLAADSNSDLALIWEGFNNDLAEKYVTFAPIYHRLLESDDVRSEF